MSNLERFGVSIEDEILSRFDELVKERGYPSRSEAIRDLIRQEFVKAEWADPDTEVIGTITIVYEHHEHELANTLTEIQHEYHHNIICTTHVHLDAHNCLEVIVVRGKSQDVRKVASILIAAHGVKHGQLVSTTTGAHI
jgi:CopG family nickel-responsive transcriptional regulator